MKRPQRKKAFAVALAARNKRKTTRVPLKPAAIKWVQTAQMPDYLLEEHPELCG